MASITKTKIYARPERVPGLSKHHLPTRKNPL